MKYRLYLFLLAAVAVLFPGRGTDVGELLPVELVRLTVHDGVIMAAADTGDFGLGATLPEAMEDLRITAPGNVFLETADYLLVTEETKGQWQCLEKWFRPGTLVYAVGEDVDPEQAAAFLRSHTGGIPLNRLEVTAVLPKLISSEGRVKIEE